MRTPKGTHQRCSTGRDPDLLEELSRRLAALSEQGPRAQPSEIAAAVESVMATVEGDLSAVNLKLYAEIEALARYIEAAKSEIAAVATDEIRDQHLPAATDELEAIVGATEQATNSILEAVESIEAIAERLGEADGQAVTEAVTKVYEACNFQDITGQRITKVVKALQQIDRKVDQLLAAFGEGDPGARKTGEAPTPPTEPESEEERDKALMNGPARPEEAVSQDDIDALLASFD